MLTQTTTYALRAMGYLAANHGAGPILSQTIAQEMDIPKNFLSKIMHQLVRSNLIKSTRGTNGGFELLKDPSKISMKDVVTLFMDIGAITNCLLGRTDCDGTCNAHKSWKPIAENIEEMLDTTTITDIS